MSTFADALFASKADLSIADALISYYNNGLTVILDVFAPVKPGLFLLVILLPGLTLNFVNLKLKAVG